MTDRSRRTSAASSRESGGPFVSADRMRRLDRLAVTRYGIPALLLMENAGRAVADETRKLLGGRRGAVAVLCGGGHNGGDGFVAARHLEASGRKTVVFVLRRPTDPDPARHLEILRRMGVKRVYADGQETAPRRWRLDRYACIVDALLGTGVSRPLEGIFLEAVRSINRSGVPVVAVDLPTGLDADTGRARGECVRAVRTVTLGLPKKGLRSPGAARWTGRVVVENLSMPVRLRELGRR